MRPFLTRVIPLVLPCLWAAHSVTASAASLPVAINSSRLRSLAPSSNAETPTCPEDSVLAGFNSPSGDCGCGQVFTPDEISRILECLALIATANYILTDGTTFNGSDIADDLGEMLDEGRIGRADGVSASCTLDDFLAETNWDRINISDNSFETDPRLCASLAHEWVHAQASGTDECAEDALAYELGMMVYLLAGGSTDDANYIFWKNLLDYYQGACPEPLATSGGNARLSAAIGSTLRDSNAPVGGGSIDRGSFHNEYIADQAAGKVILARGGAALSSFPPLQSHLFFSARHIALSDHDVVVAFGCDTTSSSSPVGALTAFDADATHLFNRNDFTMTGIKHPTGVDYDPSTGRWYILDAHLSGSGVTIWHDTNGDAIPDTQLPAAFAPPGFPGLEGGVSVTLAQHASLGTGLIVTQEDLRSHGWRGYRANIAFLRDTNSDGVADESATLPLIGLMSFPPAIAETPTDGASQLGVHAMGDHLIEIWRSDATGGARVELLGSVMTGAVGLTTVPLTKALVTGWYVMALDATLYTYLPAAKRVVPSDSPPVVTAPSGVSAAEGSLLSFQVAAADPDGDTVVLTMDASGLPPESGAAFLAIGGTPDAPLFGFTWTPTYADAGSYTAIFNATNVLSASAATQISIINVNAARAFVTNANRLIRLESGKPTWCVQVESMDGSLTIADILVESIRLASSSSGAASEIPAISGKGIDVGDEDRNGIQDLGICFGKEDLRQLLSNVAGRVSVTLTVRGDLLTGGEFEASLPIDVVGGGGISASFYPNPLSQRGTLTVSSRRPGPIRVQLFDASGRLIRTLMDETNAPAGDHDLPIDRRGGRDLPSGIYFYRVKGAEGEVSGRVAILR